MLFGGFRPAFFLSGENGRLARLPTAVNKRTCNHCDFSLFLMISKSGSLNLHMPITDNIMKIHHLNS
jgi:hypothetical protein